MEAKAHLGEILSAFEMFDKSSYDFVRHHQADGARKVFENEGEFYCLIETGGSNADHDEEVSNVTLRFPERQSVA